MGQMETVLLTYLLCPTGEKMPLTLELSPEEEQCLRQLAKKQGRKAEDVALEAVKRLLPPLQREYTREEIEAANNELFSYTRLLMP